MPKLTGILQDDCLRTLPELKPDSFTACVTDPPYGLKFMGKNWDHGVPGEPFWREVLRVCKPGAHLLAFGGTRTYHRLACAIEDAGWEIRDCIMWVYGSGFPKSHDVSKAIDKAAGAERPREKCLGLGTANSFADDEWTQQNMGQRIVDNPITDAAHLWQGYGTALKPSYEPIILARKPLSGTVASNAMEHGCGALNIDGCRIKVSEGDGWNVPQPALDVESGLIYGFKTGHGRKGDERSTPHTEGRWPANLIHDGSDEVVGLLGEAARFFYCAKANRKERTHNGQVENNHPTVKPLSLMEYLVKLVTMPKGNYVLDPFAGSGTTLVACRRVGIDCLGIEMTDEYCSIAKQRVTAQECGRRSQGGQRIKRMETGRNLL